MTEKYGFIYIWRDRKYNRFYIGSHWGYEKDKYICSSTWMRNSFQRRAEDFKRRVLENNILSKKEMYDREQHWINMIKKEEIRPNTNNPRYYNLSLFVHDSGFNVLKGKKCPCSSERASAISKAKKGKALTEEHKAALRKPKNVIYDEERKASCSKNSKQFWASEAGQITKEKLADINSSLEKRLKQSQTNKEKGHKPSRNTIEASIRKCSKTYKVISPKGEEITITNLKQFCREHNLTDINMVRKSGSKGWKAEKCQ